MSDLAGKRVLVLDLDLKKHLHLIPGENTVEIVAENHRGRKFYRNWLVGLQQRTQHEVDGGDDSRKGDVEVAPR